MDNLKFTLSIVRAITGVGGAYFLFSEVLTAYKAEKLQHYINSDDYKRLERLAKLFVEDIKTYANEEKIALPAGVDINSMNENDIKKLFNYEEKRGIYNAFNNKFKENREYANEGHLIRRSIKLKIGFSLILLSAVLDIIAICMENYRAGGIP